MRETMTRQELGRSTCSIYLGLACLSLALNLFLALFCLSVLQTGCVLAPSSSIPTETDTWHRSSISHSSSSSAASSSCKLPTTPQSKERRKLNANTFHHEKNHSFSDATERENTLIGAGKGQKVTGRFKLDVLFEHPLYNLPRPELQEDDWLLRVKSEEHLRDRGSVEEEAEDDNIGDSQWPSDSEEEGYDKVSWTSDVESHPPWLRFHLGISRWQLYDRKDPNLAQLTHYLATQRILGVVQKTGGTQLKLLVTFPNHGQALLKPMKQARDAETDLNLFYFSDFERHNAEIAAFHLDRLLGFNRIPPVVGRLINVTSEVREITTDKTLSRTFFTSPGPGGPRGDAPTAAPSWQRGWETDPAYCDSVKQKPPYSQGTRLVDLIDMAVLDFLMGNMDRHHYETFEKFGDETFLLHLDNGRAFGRHSRDEPSILVPLQQCCRIRRSTLLRLRLLSLPDFRLSDAMRESLLRDPLAAVAPLLSEPHLLALDRRLAAVLRAVEACEAHHADVFHNDVDGYDQQPD
ncbi:extracellular serine/threonine protein kinase FAM20C isoform X2 [Clinocottus analis]|uniref:extracellular serine/threonine protein kinase FAM20C isoform X2 n=1 Tax=Clinocottus analis TaxID=304258 RepID=UPI0035C2625E